MSLTPAEIARYDQLSSELQPEIDALVETWRRQAEKFGEAQAVANMIAGLAAYYPPSELAVYVVALLKRTNARKGESWS